MATIASRLTSDGSLLINGIIDEVTQNTISTNVDTILCSVFDEFSNQGSGIARRDSANGEIQISGIADEITGAPIIDGNLKLWLDAAQDISYSGTGSTWADLSPSFSDITLYGNPTFSNIVTGGSLNFVPANSQYGISSTDLGSMSNWTVEAWVKVSANLNGIITSVVTNEFNLVNSVNYSIGTNKAPGDYNLCIGFFDGAWHNTNGFAPDLDVWYQIVGTYNGSTLLQYVNGTANGSPLSYSGTSSSGGFTRIARRWDSPVSSSNLFPGDIAVVRIYNRTFSADEVSQNFNAHRRRFNI